MTSLHIIKYSHFNKLGSADIPWGRLQVRVGEISLKVISNCGVDFMLMQVTIILLRLKWTCETFHVYFRSFMAFWAKFLGMSKTRNGTFGFEGNRADNWVDWPYGKVSNHVTKRTEAQRSQIESFSAIDGKVLLSNGSLKRDETFLLRWQSVQVICFCFIRHMARPSAIKRERFFN